MAEEQELLVVGRVVAAQGLRGELRVNPLSDFPERFTRPGRRWLRPAQGRRGEAAEAAEVELLSGRQLPGKELFVIRLEGVNDRSSAEALVGHELLVPAEDRPKLARGEFHLLDLVGLEVRLLQSSEAESPAQTGRCIGTVKDLIHAGNDLLEVELTTGGAPLWIPFVKAIVPEVRLEAGWIGITPPPGLLELGQASNDKPDDADA
ncbi:ribosome maturation factor RimM [Vulcanococcus sp. Clear-D1]|jgi:16S rRNA processing protein RimM|uniref:ribosome maturation factor RimM n=1 Tax=Vulcanococcus sp. Clear-D1 TaxID=2766970 RepID=UPI0019A363F7|nr:ribosome maturation factor RimM [Vulcanococcus sp. Clear-D1]MBD1194238.1 ribosome maturation factor RimM [Vulcanococcus sp. Clear-D1]